jgi:hypothetical protein
MDGMLQGYAGCDAGLTYLAHWTADDQASTLNTSLCPVGKHGYDARCRAWYDVGKKRFLSSKHQLYLTAPSQIKIPLLFRQRL